MLAKTIASGKKPASSPGPKKQQSGDRLKAFIEEANKRSSF
jgi:hypothetical protein